MGDRGEYYRRYYQEHKARKAEYNRTHRDKLRGVHANMLQRCGIIKGGHERDLENYARRGITVCPEWRTFAPFRDWALANGYREGLQIDRVDNDGNYSPENCRWVTPSENARNRRSNTVVEYNGERMTVTEFAERYGEGENAETVVQRVRRGVPLHEAVADDYQEGDAEKILFPDGIEDFRREIFAQLGITPRVFANVCRFTRLNCECGKK